MTFTDTIAKVIVEIIRAILNQKTNADRLALAQRLARIAAHQQGVEEILKDK